MCGIAGILNTNGAPVAAESLAAMAAALRHRGPDDEGIWTDGAVGLAHRRLSIIDLAGGHQPMANEAGTTWVCFNGEIYNYPELRRELESAGVRFRTHCDTEVLIHLYDRLGDAMMERLWGMFAFAIWDASRRRLLLARDRLGKKPLYYTFARGRLAFASELFALRVLPGFAARIRPQSVLDYLTYQYVPGPETVYEGVRKLPPASCLVCAADQTAEPEPRTYWSPDYGHKVDLSLGEAAEQLRDLLGDAVRRRLMSDVPLGAFLSGGVDSSITVGLMAQAMDRPVQTFTIGFEAAKYDEREFAAAASRHFATDHHVRVVDPRDFGVVRGLVRHYGEPFCDASMLPTYLLAQFTRTGVTVALSGDGADEVFGGYYRYRVMQAARAFDLLPRELRRGAAAALLRLLPPKTEERTVGGALVRLTELARSATDERYLDLISRFPEARKRSVCGPALLAADPVPSSHYLAAWFARATAADPTERVAEVDLHTYLPGDILTKVDIASMAVSLEVRSPFLDHRVVEFAAALPWRLKQTLTARKRVLLAAFGDRLPTCVTARPKRGFGVPLARWFRADWLPLLREVLLDPAVEQRGLLDRHAMARLIDEHAARRADHSYSLWALLLLELWCQEVHGAGPATRA